MRSWPVNFFSRPTLGCPPLSSFGALDAPAPDLRPRAPSFGARPALPLGAVASVGLLRAMSSGEGGGGLLRVDLRRSGLVGQSARLDGLLVEAAGAVGAADQRTGQHAGEPGPLRLGRENDEILRP